MPRSARAQLTVVCIASFVVWSGFGAILPNLTIFLKDQAHSTMGMIGLIGSAYYVGTFAFSAILGRASDTVGRKPIIVLGTCLYSVATLLFVTTAHPGWFTLFRLLEGIGAAAVGPASQAFIADITTDDVRGRAYGWLTTAQFGGLIAGPALAMPLYALGGGGKWGFYSIFLFGSALSAITVVVLLMTIKEPERTARRRAEEKAKVSYRKLLTPPIIAFLLVAATGHFAMGAFEVLWSIWLQRVGANQPYINATWIVFSVPMLLSFVGGRFAERGNRFLLMFSGYAISACAWIIYGTTRNLVFFIIVNALEGFAIAWSYPAKQSFLVQVAPPRWLGTVQGIEGTSMQLAALVGTATAPILYEFMSGYTIALGGVVSLVGLAIAAPILSREWKRITESGELMTYRHVEEMVEDSRPALQANRPLDVE
jgi:MFS family permease